MKMQSRSSSKAKHLRHVTQPEDRIPLQQLVAFGFGGIIPIALFNIAGQLMVLIGNISLGLSAFWLGVIMIIPRLWDAVSDPGSGFHFVFPYLPGPLFFSANQPAVNRNRHCVFDKFKAKEVEYVKIWKHPVLP